MKKFGICLSLGLLMLASCQDDPDQPENTLQLSGNMTTCVVPLHGDDDSKVVLTNTPTYTYTLYTLGGYWVAGVHNLSIPGVGSMDFTTPHLTASSGDNFILSYNDDIEGGNGMKVSSFVSAFIQDYNYYTGDASLNGSRPFGVALTTMAFNVNDEYMVRAFPKMCYYAGSLVTKYTDTDGSERESTMLTPQFGVKVDADSRTAEIMMHNVKFADNMPVTIPLITLKGLTFKGDTNDGYEISGENVVPMVTMNGETVSYPMFTFDEIKMHPTTTQMTTCEIKFKVAGKYKGWFTGSIAK